MGSGCSTEEHDETQREENRPIVGQVQGAQRQKQEKYHTEVNAWITISALLVLTIGVCLEVKQVVARTAGSAPPLLQEFLLSEVFDLTCMVVAIVWMSYYLIRKALRHYKDNEGSTEKEHDHVIDMYLIYGLCLFAIGGSVLGLCQFVAFISYSCSTNVGWCYSFFKIVFVLDQFSFIYSNHSKATFSKSFFNGVMVFHVIATNVILYLRTFIEGQIHSADSTTNNVTSLNCTMPSNANSTFCQCTVHNEDLVDMYQQSSEYLYPFFLEFSLTASALLADIWTEIKDEVEETTDGNPMRNVPIIDNRSQLNTTTITDRLRQLPSSVVPKSPAGIIGLILVGIDVFMIILMHFRDNSTNPVSMFRLYRTGKAILMMSFAILGHVSLRNHPAVKGGITLLEIILFVSLFGVLCDEVFDLVACIDTLVNPGENLKVESLVKEVTILMVEQIVWTLEIISQVTLISKALHRKAMAAKGCCGLLNAAHFAILLALSNFGKLGDLSTREGDA